MTEPIKPALTAEEWADPEHRVERDGFWIYEPPILDCPVIGSEGSGVSIGTVRHALAALALSGQPFGFTREMLLALKRLLAHHIAEDRGRDGDTWYSDEVEKLVALGQDAVDRIEALLPPEKPS